VSSADLRRLSRSSHTHEQEQAKRGVEGPQGELGEQVGADRGKPAAGRELPGGVDAMGERHPADSHTHPPGQGHQRHVHPGEDHENAKDYVGRDHGFADPQGDRGAEQAQPGCVRAPHMLPATAPTRLP
jgi:hypothetical protein